MPKEKQSVCGRLRSYVTEFGSDTFSIVANSLFCKVCEIRISSEKKFNVSQLLVLLNTKKLSDDKKTKNRKKTNTIDQFANKVGIQYRFMRSFNGGKYSFE